MDNSMQSAHNHHVFDPALAHNHNGPTGGAESQQQQEATSSDAPQVVPMPPSFNPDGTPIKRRPGRPKGSTKKHLLGASPIPPKIKRPVGRPRKDGYPAGSVGTTKVKKERVAVQQQGMPLVYGGVGYPPVPCDFSVSAPLPPDGVVPPMFQIDPSLERVPTGDNEWADLARTNPNAFLATMLAALAAPNPVSSAGPTVEEAFKSHLVSLAPNPSQMQPIPSLYSILKTFWLPSSPAYFSLTASASTARTPSEHRFLYWDPQPLVFNGIACPSCSAPLMNKGRISSGPVKIYDIEKPFFIVGCEYACRSPACVAATGSAEGRKFASTDSSILRSLPTLLKDEFPARLLHGDADAGTGPNMWNWKAMGVSTGLWNLVMGALRAGLKKDLILRLIWSVQHKLPEGMGEAMLGQASGMQESASTSGEQGHTHEDGDDDKMDDDEDGEGDEGSHDGGGEHVVGGVDGASAAPVPNQNHTVSSTTFSDAYGDAWKENTAMTESLQKPPSGAAPSSSASQAHPTPTPQPQHQQQQQQPQQPQQQQASQVSAPSSTPATAAPTPVPMPPPQMMQHAPGYNPYTAYPFTPYTFMPHHLVNGQMVPLGVGQIPPSSSSSPMPPPPQQPQQAPSAADGGSGNANANSSPRTATPNANANGGQNGSVGGGATIIQGGSNKRSPRHCCKCGSQECKGKGGRSFCMNACQDCGKLDCKGRNSRRPDKKCGEGWT